MSTAELILVRGLPGSGKSTLARAYSVADGFEHYEADSFFERDDGYRFDSELLAAAHRWCLERTEAAIARGARVVVANTFTRAWEMKPYLACALRHGAFFGVIEAKGRYQNVHGVPPEAIEAMAARWEPVEWLVSPPADVGFGNTSAVI